MLFNLHSLASLAAARLAMMSLALATTFLAAVRLAVVLQDLVRLLLLAAFVPACSFPGADLHKKGPSVNEIILLLMPLCKEDGNV